MFLGVGGRYHTTQVDLSGHGTLVSNGPDGPDVSSGMVGVDNESLRDVLITFCIGLSFFSGGVAAVVAEMAADLKSNAVPGVFGVLVEEPKDANAPDPSPNAEEPPVVGDASPPVVKGGMVLKGFLPPCDESPPNRFVAENVRCGASGFSPWASECDMDRESLLLLLGAISVEPRRCGDSGSILGAAGPQILPVIHWQSYEGEGKLRTARETLSKAWWDK